MHAAVPRVEVADDADAIGVGRPHGEVHTGGRPERDPMRPELLERAMVRAFSEQMEIEIREHPAVPKRIVDLDRVVAGIRDPQPVIGRAAVDVRLVEARRIPLRHRDHLTVGDETHLDVSSGRLEDTNHRAAAVGFFSSRMRTEHAERIAVVAADECRNGGVQLACLTHSHDNDLNGRYFSIVAFLM